MNDQVTVELLHEKFQEEVQVRVLPNEDCVVRVPFGDSIGDSIELTVVSDGDQVKIHDGGNISGLLFSLGQHVEGTPAFKLLMDLERAHGLEVDFNEGLVKVSVPKHALYDGIAELATVVMALHTVVPHIRVAPRRMKALGRPRLKSKIKNIYRERKILELVESDFYVDGTTVSNWPVDFHWLVQTNGHLQEVDVVATDLTVANPLEKAQRVAAFSVDTQGRHEDGGVLRVMVDTPQGNTQATEAANFLRYHGDHLGYRVFDYGNFDERAQFFDVAVGELTGQAGEAWRQIWLTREYTPPVGR